MRFCPNCENILIPRNKLLYCKVCNQEFELKPDCFNEYKVSISLRQEHEQIMPIIIRNGLRNTRLSNELRKAYEDFFINSTY